MALRVLNIHLLLTVCLFVVETDSRHYSGFSRQQDRRSKRAVTADSSKLWPNATIPYKFDRKFSDEYSGILLQAMEYWQNNTCIQFVQKGRDVEDFLLVRKELCGCCSSVGRVGGAQTLSLTESCISLSVAIHELGHVIGFWHEHTRPDRDQYVAVNLENVMETKRINFQQRNEFEIDSLRRPYDIRSIMHYGAKTFTSNGGDTLRSLVPGMTLYRSRSTPSSEDYLQANLLYSCPLPSCDRYIDTLGSGNISSPHYPIRYLSETDCYFKFLPPDGAMVNITFHSFQLQDGYRCTSDYLEIFTINDPSILHPDDRWMLASRLRSPVYSTTKGKFCGSQGHPPPFASTQPVILHFHSDWRDERSGFLAYYNIYQPSTFDRLLLNIVDDTSWNYISQPCVQVSDKRIGSYKTPEFSDHDKVEPLKCSFTVNGGHLASSIFVTLDPQNSFAYGDDCMGVVYSYRRGSRKVGMFEAEADTDSLDPTSWSRVPYVCGHAPTVNISVETAKLVLIWSSSNTPLSLKYWIDYNECEHNSHRCEHTCVNTVEGYSCTCRPGYAIADVYRCVSKTPQTIDRCDGSVTSLTGRILSSSEPVRMCSFHIRLPGYKIFLKINKVRLSQPPNSCNNNLTVSSNKKLIAVVCGDTSIELSAGDVMTITRFMSADTWNVPYFMAEYTSVKKTQDRCMYTLAGQDNFTSPDYPQRYPDDLNCIWKLSVELGSKIRLTITHIDIEDTQACLFDRLAVYDGRTRSSRLALTLCGQRANIQFVSSDRHLVMELITDDSGSGRGFAASFKSIPNDDTAPIPPAPPIKSRSLFPQFTQSQDQIWPN